MHAALHDDLFLVRALAVAETLPASLVPHGNYASDMLEAQNEDGRANPLVLCVLRASLSCFRLEQSDCSQEEARAIESWFVSWSEAFSNNLDVTTAETLRDTAGMAWARLTSALHAFLERHVSGGARFERIAALESGAHGHCRAREARTRFVPLRPRWRLACAMASARATDGPRGRGETHAPEHDAR